MDPDYNTLEPYRTQHVRPAACGIAHQYSSANFVQFRLHSNKAKFGASNELYFFVGLLFKKMNSSETA